MAAIVSRGRLWLAVGPVRHRRGVPGVGYPGPVRPMLEAPSSLAEEHSELSGTPFEDMPALVHSPPLSHRERINVVFVVAMSQLDRCSPRRR